MSKIKIVSFFDKLFLFFIVIYAGNANVMTRSLSTWDNSIGVVFILLLLTIFKLKNNFKFKKKYFKVVLVFSVYSTILFFKFGEFHPKFFLIWFLNLTLAYSIVNYFNYRLFFLFEKIMIQLCLVSLLFFFFLLVATDPFINLLKNLSIFEPAWENGEANIFIYTINEQSRIILGGFRNAGFAWEPGAFACLIVLAIYCNLLINKFKLFNFRFYILLASLISCFSSTGFALLILILIFYQLNIRVKSRFLVFPFICTVSLYIFSLPDVSTKIGDTITFDVDKTISNMKLYDLKYSPQRFESFAIDFIDFLAHPIVGYGGHQDARWTSKIGLEIGTISGIGKVFGKYGLFGIFLFFVVLYKTSKLYYRKFQYKGKFFFFLIILFISFSYSLIESPLFLAFWMYSLLLEKKSHKIKNSLDYTSKNES